MMRYYGWGPAMCLVIPGFLLTALTNRSIEASPTARELQAIMPADVGPDTIDVSTYSREQQDNYKVFLEKCSRCHSPARPINSSMTSQAQWKHFVHMMYGRRLSRNMGPAWKKEEIERIIDFLTYDSKARKLEHREAFQAQLKWNAERFDELQKGKAETAKHQQTKPSAPYTGAVP